MQEREVLRHVDALDGVRGLAILLVLLLHLLWSNPQTGRPWVDLFAKVHAAGWVGVDLLFALSGFLITGILYDSLDDRRYFRNFYGRRMLRIFPLYYGVLGVLCLLFHASLWVQRVPVLLLLGYLQNTPLWWHQTRALPLVELTGHLWSLAVEEQFYLAWPLVIFLVKDRKRLIWICAAIVALALMSRVLLLHNGAPFVATYKLIFCRADSLAGGAWLAMMMRGERREQVLRLAPYAFSGATALCLLIAWRTGSFDWETGRAINQYGFTILAAGSAALIAMALRPASVTGRLFRAPALRWLGKYSYGIYVYHQLIAEGLPWMPLLGRHIHSKLMLHAVFFVVVGGLSLIVAWVSFHFYERRFLALKRYFNYDTPRGQAAERSSSLVVG